MPKTSIFAMAKKSLFRVLSHWHSIDQQEILTGGKWRQKRGADIEQWVTRVIQYVAKKKGFPITVKRGSEDLQTLTITDLKTGVLYTKEHQVDLHVYIQNELRICIECKAYLDSCFYTRACHDFSLFKKVGTFPNVRCYILALEESINSQNRAFTDVVTDGVCDDIFVLFEGKRQSKKPLFQRAYRKPLIQEQLRRFLNIFDIPK